MTRSRPSAAAKMINAVMTRVTQAAAGMTVLPQLFSGRSFATEPA